MTLSYTWSTRDPNETEKLRWKWDGQIYQGEELLDVAYPGLLWLEEKDQELQVPHSVFFEWIYKIAERLLRSYINLPGCREHEVEWMINAAVLISNSAPSTEPSPPEPSEGEDEQDIRGSILMVMATLHPLPIIGGVKLEVGKEIVEWITRALEWAGKRHLKDRRCSITPVELAKQAIEIQGDCADYHNDDVTEARTSERQEQVLSFAQLCYDLSSL